MDEVSDIQCTINLPLFANTPSIMNVTGFTGIGIIIANYIPTAIETHIAGTLPNGALLSVGYASNMNLLISANDNCTTDVLNSQGYFTKTFSGVNIPDVIDQTVYIQSNVDIPDDGSGSVLRVRLYSVNPSQY